MGTEQYQENAIKRHEQYMQDKEQREALILTNAPVPFYLNGRELKARCLSDRDYTALDEWVKSRFIRVARESCTGLDPDERREMLEIAIKSVAGMSWTYGEGAQIIYSKEGIAFIAYMMIKEDHPEISYEWLVEACSKDYNIEEVGRVFNHFNQQLDSLKSNGQAKKDSGKN